MDEAAYAYIKGKSATDAARKVTGSQYVLKCDISNFFPSITSKRIYGLYRSLGMRVKPAHVLTKLTTYNGTLSQGSPTSPTLSNLICRSMDRELKRIAVKYHVKYIRYSDDIIFFGNSSFNKNKLMNCVDMVLKKHSFSLNFSKTKFYSKTKNKFILGVNASGDKIKLPRKVARVYRAAFYKASTNLNWAETNLSRLMGMAEYYKCIYGKDAVYADYKNIINNTKKIKLHHAYVV